MLKLPKAYRNCIKHMCLEQQNTKKLLLAAVYAFVKPHLFKNCFEILAGKHSNWHRIEKLILIEKQVKIWKTIYFCCSGFSTDQSWVEHQKCTKIFLLHGFKKRSKSKFWKADTVFWCSWWGIRNFYWERSNILAIYLHSYTSKKYGMKLVWLL